MTIADEFGRFCFPFSIGVCAKQAIVRHAYVGGSEICRTDRDSKNSQLSKRGKTVTRVSRFLVFAVLLTLAAVAPAWAQETALTGTVKDPTGAVISGATITVTNEATGATRTATTDGDGRYLISRLDPGSYKVEVKMQGFKTSQTPKVAVPISITTRFDVSLTLGDIAETVIVEAETARINTVDASLGNPFSGDEVRKLPSLDLNPAGLLSLQAGVTFVPGAADGSGGYSGTNLSDHRGGSVSGSRSDQTNITLDGVDVNDPVQGTAFFSALRVTQESLQEFRVTTTNYNADQGRSSAAQVSLVTKSGTNNLHGSAYYLHRNEALNANDFFLNRAGQEEGQFRRHLYGASLGGPVVKNRFFLFGNWERMEEKIFESAERSVPAAHMRDGVFFYRCSTTAGFAPCVGGNTVAGVSGSMWTAPTGFHALSPGDIDSLDLGGSGPNAATLAAWQALPLPNSTGIADGLNVLGFTFAAPINNTFNVYILRADYHLDSASKHTLFWRGTLQDDLTNSAPNLPGSPSFDAILNASKGFSLGYTAVMSNTVVNNFRWGLTRIKDATSGLRNAAFVRHRFIDDTQGFFNQNDGTSATNGRIIPQHHFRDDVTWTRGTHSFTFGGEARHTRNNRFRDNASFHTIVVNPSWLPGGGGEVSPGHNLCSSARPECAAFPAVNGRSVRDYMTVMIAPLSQVSASYNFDRTGATLPDGSIVERKFAVDEYELYAQDQWRMFSNMTLTYGLRWYYATPPWEANGNQVVPNPRISEWIRCRETAMNTGLPSSIACGHIEMVLGGKENNGRPYYDPDTNNFSPRVAVAWSPRGMGWLTGGDKMTVRAGYSLVYDRIGNALAVSFDTGGSFGMATALSNGLASCSIGGASPSGGAAVIPVCPRFTSYLDTAAGFAGAGPGLGLQPSPGASFPATPPLDLSSVAATIDDRLRTPYSHAITVSIAREIPWNMSIEGSYVGRYGRKLPISRDFAMTADFRDPASGVRWFEAERQLVQAAANGVALQNIGTIPFWENLFPAWSAGWNQGCLQFNTFGLTTNADGSAVNPAQCFGLGVPMGYTTSQVAYDYVMGYHGVGGVEGFGASTVAEDIDRLQFLPAMSCPQGTDNDGSGDGFTDCRYALFPGQWVQLSGLTGISRSQYNAFQFTLRKRASRGLLFNINYTLSQSKDHSSTPERFNAGAAIGAGYSGYMINSWDLEQQWAVSDFDITHQLNAHWVYELPFGRGRTWGAGMNSVGNAVLGGWSISGIFRANSGLPLTVINGRTWPTNWNYQGNAVCVPSGAYPLGLATGPCPATKTTKGVTHASGGNAPNAFADPDAAFSQFRFGAPGESGGRNQMRGDKYITLDFGIGKSFNAPWEGHRFEFRWDIFNLMNSAYFDTGSINASRGDQDTFGDYTAVLGGPRRMQVQLRYQF